MSLSNTATPFYYGKFRDAVLRGDIVVNQYISMEMNRIDSLIRDPKIYYDDRALDGYIHFCENELCLTDGSDLILLDSFKLWAEQVLCWYYFEDISVYTPYQDNHGGRYVRKKKKKRLINKQYLIVARGASKSFYASTLHNYFLNIDRTSKQQIVTAPTMRQADETISPIKTSIIRSKGPLFKFLTYGSLQNTTGSQVNKVKLLSTKKGIENRLTGSFIEIRPMSIDKLQGLRPKISTVDEWLSGEIREDPIGALEQGASKLDDYLIVATSSEGTIRNGSGDTIKMELMSILKGEYYNPHVSIFYYRLDDISEIKDPSKWQKANPNIGEIVSYETYQLDVERAEKVPAARNDIIAKRFGIPMEGFTYFFSYDDIQLHKRREYWNMPCALGMDLSKGDDFCAFNFLFPLGKEYFGNKARSYITSKTLMCLPLAMRQKYEEFIKEGSLIVMEGTTLDIVDVYDDLVKHIDYCKYDVQCVGYDPYNAQYFIERWTQEHGPFGIEKVAQGYRTETVPLGEIKKLVEAGHWEFDQEIMKFAMGNAITIEDTNGNRKLLKERRDKKIDNVSAAMDSYIAYKANVDAFS